MKHGLAVMVLCAFLAPSSAFSLNCAKAASPVEKALCGSPELSRLDEDLTQRYISLRSQMTARAKGELLTQQRAWLSERDRLCATGDTACLAKQYQLRIGQLDALKATADASDDPLADAVPLTLEGNWKATGIHDPASAGPRDDAAIRQSLADAQLPGIGAAVNAVPGKLCFPPGPCDRMGWARKTLAQVDGGEAISRVLELSPSTRVLVGSSGSIRSYYLLMPRKDGTVWAFFTLCPADKNDCRFAAELWTPTSSAVAIPARL